MKIAIASDHGGFELKSALLKSFQAGGVEVADLGPSCADSCDYPDYAVKFALDVASGAADEGVQENLSPSQIARYVIAKYDKPERLAEMRAKMLALATPDAATRVAQLVEECARR